jgi:hypothetical protein
MSAFQPSVARSRANPPADQDAAAALIGGGHGQSVPDLPGTQRRLVARPAPGPQGFGESVCPDVLLSLGSVPGLVAGSSARSWSCRAWTVTLWPVMALTGSGILVCGATCRLVARHGLPAGHRRACGAAPTGTTSAPALAARLGSGAREAWSGVSVMPDPGGGPP